METANQSTITISTTVNAPVEKVWEVWNNPSHITNWCSASPDWHAPYADNDARTGGKFKTTMAAKDGSFQFDFEGVYDKVEAFKNIEYTMPDGRKVWIEFKEEGSKSSITEIFNPEATNPIEMQQSGWQAILDNFKSYTESLP